MNIFKGHILYVYRISFLLRIVNSIYLMLYMVEKNDKARDCEEMEASIQLETRALVLGSIHKSRQFVMCQSFVKRLKGER